MLLGTDASSLWHAAVGGTELHAKDYGVTT
jgi:hypothetical protein